MKCVQISPNAWVNPDYIMGIVLHNGEDGLQRVLTLTMSTSTNGVHPDYPDIYDPWIDKVLVALGLADKHDGKITRN